MVMRIYLYGEEILRQKASPVDKIDNGVRDLIRNMGETMRHGGGVGLAAPQVGESRRIIVAEVPQEQTGLVALVNPTIVQSAGLSDLEEGCLSIPGYVGQIKRAESVTVKGRDQNGKEIRIKADELLAQALEHEIDHLNGVLYIDHLDSMDKLRKIEPDEAQL